MVKRQTSPISSDYGTHSQLADSGNGAALRSHLTDIFTCRTMRRAGTTSIHPADRAVTAGHDIHVTMRTLSMPVDPDKLFRLTAGRTARHHMRRVVGPGLRFPLVTVR